MTIVGLISVLVLTATPEIPKKGPCKDTLDTSIFVSPRYPNSRSKLTLMVTSETPLAGKTLAARDPKGNIHMLEPKAYGGPPYGWAVRIDKPMAGAWRIGVGDGEALVACQKVRVRSRGGRVAVGEPEVDPIWTSRWKWERDTENLFSLWVEALFDVPPDEQPTWRPFHEALRNSERNLLFNHMNLGEDGPRKETQMRLRPDCADFPYHLRAYFAWKMALPFAFRRCRRGNAKRAPTCSRETESNQLISDQKLIVRSVQNFIQRTVGGSVHSSSPRTLPKDDRSDFYPVKMTRRSIRPGSIFADPYGHILVVAKWYPQVDGKPGVLFAVDAQPDKTVGRRRFWPGSFLFPEDGAVSGAGFKRFRPVKRTRDGRIIVRNNTWIAENPLDYGDYSTEQWDNGKAAFYEQMDALIHPEPMEPKVAYGAALDALTEQVERRVLSVDAAEGWKRKNPGREVEMPVASKLFQTAGPWEDYSTPSRDLRLLIAIQTVVDYPRRVVKYPARFHLPEGKTPAEARAALEENLMAEAGRRTFEYTRSDGSKQTISVGDVIRRRKDMEMAYNPNDCPEIRWAAPKDSPEAATCKAHAPEAQRERMGEYRSWFANRQRPVH
ncbi:MAG: hypothetical protein ACI9WU_005471 [Myxococcota bacterium]|jgi:hypothetical protein